MPEAITIPGAVAAWSLLHKEMVICHGKNFLVQLLTLQTKGIKVHERVHWSKNKKLSLDSDTSKIFLKNGKSFKFMDNFKNENLSETFRTIAQEGYEWFLSWVGC